MEHRISQGLIVNILDSVAREVFVTMLDLQVRTEASYTERQPGESHGVVSFVGLAGSGSAGTGSLQCESDVACRLASRFLMAEFESVNDEVLDAFGELTNIIIGNFKNAIECHLGQMGLSIPTVVCGSNFSARNLSDQVWTVVPFSWEGDRLNVKICLSLIAPATIRHEHKHELVSQD
jgi:chemotaxis protein CheX